MELTSTVFEHMGSIPRKYTCDGESISPPLSIRETPEGAASLVLILEDSDVPKERIPSGMFDHWILFNISPDTTEIREGETPECAQGMTTAGGLEYVGPCPPEREHRYFFKLFALDSLLEIPPGATKRRILNVMRGHIIEQTELIARYERTK